MQSKFDAAIIEIREALRINPNDAVAHNSLGGVYEDQGKLDEAVREYREALRMNPNFAVAHYNLALAIEATGKHGDALEQWKRYLAIARDIPAQEGQIPEAKQHIKDWGNKLQ